MPPMEQHTHTAYGPRPPSSDMRERRPTLVVRHPVSMTGNGLPPRYYYAMQGDEAYSIEGTEQFIKVYVNRPDKNGKFPNSAASRENAHDHPLNSAIAFFPRGLRDPEWHSIVDNCAVLTLGGIPSIWPLGAREMT